MLQQKDYALKVDVETQKVETQKVDVETRVMASCLVSLVVVNVYICQLAASKRT